MAGGAAGEGLAGGGAAVRRVQRPDAAAWQLDTPLERFDRLALVFLRSGRPWRRARLSQLMFGIGLTFEDGSLTGQSRRWRWTDRAAAADGKFEWTAVNINRLTGQERGYDPDDPAGSGVTLSSGARSAGIRAGDQPGAEMGDAAQMDWAALS